MVHLVFIYELLALFVIIVSFNIPLFIYFKTRDKFLFHYIIFFLPFIIDCVLSVMINYMRANLYLKSSIGSFQFDFYIFLIYCKDYVFILILFSIVYFCHYIYNIEYKNILNIILTFVCALLLVLVHFTLSVKCTKTRSRAQTKVKIIFRIFL
jgi:hypothetical protein